MAIADQRNGGSATAPPQNLEAEQSVLGAVLLSDTALPALIIDERLQPEDFYREAHGLIFQAMLDLHTVGEPVDALTLVEHLKQAGLLENVGGRAAVDLLAGSVPAVGNVRQYARIVRENAMLRRLLRASYEIQARVHSHEAPPRELVDLAERSILEVAHDDRRKDFRAIHDLLSAELDKLEQLSAARHLDHRHAVGLRGPRPHHRRLPARQPDHPRRTPWHGQVPGRLLARLRPGDGRAAPDRRRRRSRRARRGGRGRRGRAPTSSSASRAVSAGLRSGVQATSTASRTRLGRRLDATANHPLLTARGLARAAASSSRARASRSRGSFRAPIASDVDARPRGRAARRADRRRQPHRAHAALLLRARTRSIAAGRRGRPRRAGSAPARRRERDGDDQRRRGGSAEPAHRPAATPRPVGPPLGRRSSCPTRSSASATSRSRASSSVLYACDGHVYCSERYAQIGYTTISERLAHDVQHLLLRLGIVAAIRTLQREVYEGTATVAPRGADHRPRRPRGVRAARRGRRQGRAASSASLARQRGARPTPTSTRSRSRCGSSVLAAKGERSLGRGQRRGRAPAQPQLARRHARPLAPPARPRWREATAQRARSASPRVGPVVGRGRLDRGPRRAGDLRPHRPRRAQLRRRRHRRPQQRARWPTSPSTRR